MFGTLLISCHLPFKESSLFLESKLLFMLIFSSCLISLLGGNYGKVFVIFWKRYS
jgi:hypothetical protein